VTSASSRDAQVPGPSQDLFRIYAARAARGLGDDFAIIVLPAYLPEIGFSTFKVGVVASVLPIAPKSI
jgi:hypothetical protein